MEIHQQIYRHRFSNEDQASMDKVWKVLVSHYFQKWIQSGDTVLDLGAGLCSFINHVSAARKFALDANPDVAHKCNTDVHFFQSSNLDEVDFRLSLDVVFVSNFFEHLDSSNDVLRTLSAIHKKLKPGGRVLILQPNFSLTGARYFDFIDHKTILTDQSLLEALEITGFQTKYWKRRFLPYTSKSMFPKAPWLVHLYLMNPLAQWIFGKQSFFVAEKSVL